MKSYSSFLLILTFALHAGCGSGTGSNRPGIAVPSEGTYAWLQANLDEEDNLQLAASVYKDGVKADLVGGDVIHATQGTQVLQLRGIALRSGDYAGHLRAANDAEPVLFSVDYEPEQSREDRWYPSDILRVDPGPGPLVGLQAQAILPPRVEILAPADLTTITGSNAEFELVWEPAGEGDEMGVVGTVLCRGNGEPLVYAVSHTLGADDGTATLNMSRFIPNQTLLELADVLVTSLVRILVESMFEALFNGLINPDLQNPLPRSIDSCDIHLVLLRERESEISGGFDNALVTGSTSASISIIYRPGA